MAIAGGPIEPEEAVSTIRSGDRVMVGGFGLVGAPLTLIDALVESSDADELTIVSNNIGEPGRGLGKLLRQGRIKRGISSYFTSNPEARSEEHTSELQSQSNLVCRLLLEKKKNTKKNLIREEARGENIVDAAPYTY